MPKAKNFILGIDLGTTNSCASYVDEDGHPRIIRSGKGYTTLPSVVGMNKKGEIVVGHTALDQMISNPSDTIYGSKRLIGRKFQSLVVQEMRELMPYNIVAGTNGEAAVLMSGKVYDLSEISSMILSEIKQYAEGTLEAEVKEAIITVPAYYNDNQRQAVKRAGELAGIHVRRIINEPTAAAIAYGLNKGFKQKILVYDFGGGTFDVSILEIRGNEFKVVGTGGDTFLGGIDIDNRLTGFALEKFRKQAGKDLINEKVAVSRLRMAAEQAKCNLSIQKSVDILLPYITEIEGKAIDLKLQITRDQLNQLSKDLVERTLLMCDEVMESSGVKKEKIDEIILVGGQTRMPLVREMIEHHFGKTPRKGVHPEEVVAVGASILAEPEIASSPVELHDVLSIPIGIALLNGKFKVVLDRNTAIPAKRSFKITQDRHETLMVDIYQGERAHILENEYLGTFCFPSPEEGEVGRSLEMRFELSAECLLRVRIKDPKSNEEIVTEMITLQTPQSMKKAMQEAMQNTKVEKTNGFRAFAQRILGFGR